MKTIKTKVGVTEISYTLVKEDGTLSDVKTSTVIGKLNEKASKESLKTLLQASLVGESVVLTEAKPVYISHIHKKVAYEADLNKFIEIASEVPEQQEIDVNENNEFEVY